MPVPVPKVHVPVTKMPIPVLRVPVPVLRVPVPLLRVPVPVSTVPDACTCAMGCPSWGSCRRGRASSSVAAPLHASSGHSNALKDYICSNYYVVAGREAYIKRWTDGLIRIVHFQRKHETLHIYIISNMSLGRSYIGLYMGTVFMSWVSVFFWATTNNRINTNSKSNRFLQRWFNYNPLLPFLEIKDFWQRKTHPAEFLLHATPPPPNFLPLPLLMPLKLCCRMWNT